MKSELSPIVDLDFDPPLELRTGHALLRPLGPEHNESDHVAWTSSIAHIRATPGFGPPHDWPDEEITLAKNLADLEMHRRHFDERVGFTYTVLDQLMPDEVVGCVYMYADPTGSAEVEVRSWVVASRPELDVEIWSAVTNWLRLEWPFTTWSYEPRT